MTDYYDGVCDVTPSMSASPVLVARSQLTPDGAKLVVAMVGMPCRGKSSIARKLSAFLSWKGDNVRIFNAGRARRQLTDEQKTPNCSAQWFDPSNNEAQAAKEEIAMSTLDNLLEWLTSEGDVGFFDATNSTSKRRSAISDRVSRASARSEIPIRILFLESLCDDPQILEQNALNKARTSPDFAGLSEAEALASLKERLAHYQRAYEPLQPPEGSYITVLNMSSYVVANQVFGRLTRSVLPFVCAIHTTERPIFLTALTPRDTEKEFSRLQNACMNGDGGACLLVDEIDRDQATRLAAWLQGRMLQGQRLVVLASTQPAGLEAAAAVADKVGSTATHQSGLNPMDRGTRPLETEDESHMSFTTRFEGGESYADLVHRLEPCLLEIEASTTAVLVIAHATPCRALRAYFLGLAVSKCMMAASSPGARALSDAEPCVVELTPVRGRYQETIHRLGPPKL
mmetsp:Transcript_59833/g.129646  ORF Transcript_59833/g.129646 Transcript_59833/m.129646 type:complete len:457 (-) Transcript_59833:185-1555(-)